MCRDLVWGARRVLAEMSFNNSKLVRDELERFLLHLIVRDHCVRIRDLQERLEYLAKATDVVRNRFRILSINPRCDSRELLSELLDENNPTMYQFYPSAVALHAFLDNKESRVDVNTLLLDMALLARECSRKLSVAIVDHPEPRIHAV